MISEALQTRAAVVASLAVRGAWFKTPGSYSRIKVKEYSKVAACGRPRGTLPPANKIGPVHRCEVVWRIGRLYVAVLVPSGLVGFEGMLSWIDIWCSFNRNNPYGTVGVLFSGTPVDTSAWRIAGWVDQYLEEPVGDDDCVDDDNV